MPIKQVYPSVLPVTPLHIEKVLQIFQPLFFLRWTPTRNNTPTLPYNQIKVPLYHSKIANDSTETWKDYLNSSVASDKHLTFEAIIESKIWYQNLKVRIMDRDSSIEKYHQATLREIIWKSLDTSKTIKFYTVLKLSINLKIQNLIKN